MSRGYESGKSPYGKEPLRIASQKVFWYTSFTSSASEIAPILLDDGLEFVNKTYAGMEEIW